MIKYCRRVHPSPDHGMEINAYLNFFLFRPAWQIESHESGSRSDKNAHLDKLEKNTMVRFGSLA